MQLFIPPLNDQETAPENNQARTPTEDTADEQDTFKAAQNEPPAKAAIVQDNIATNAATQRNKAMGSATRVVRNEAHGRGTKQENSATNCVLM